MLLETSYLAAQQRNQEFYSTKVLLSLIKILGEKDSKTHDVLMKSRANHLRQMTQHKVMLSQKIDPVLKPYLDSTMLIFKEFTELNIPE